ncbi:MAG: hypothetical protein ACP5E5_10970 [Acidobacteriaceae bacterium]
MDFSNNCSSARRSEDIALDLLKFLAPFVHLGNKSASGTGFGLPSAPRSEEQIDQLFELYTRCRVAVEAPLQPTATGSAAQK